MLCNDRPTPMRYTVINKGAEQQQDLSASLMK